MIVVGAVIIQQNGILLVRVGTTWIFPGGKLEEGESHEECLLREVDEELPGLRLSNLREFGDFFGRAVHGDGSVSLAVYLVEAEGEYNLGDGIDEAKFVAKPEELNLAEATRKTIAALRLEGCL